MTRRTRARAEAAVLYRVQAADGRGPWRPGLSKHWIDDNSDSPLQADVISAFGTGWLWAIPEGWHAGCGCRTLSKLMKWFTPIEQSRLYGMGYLPVKIWPDKIIAENDDQVVFACKVPLALCNIALTWSFATDKRTHEIEART